MTYMQYLFLTWLPGYLQAAHGLTIMASGLYTALPYALAVLSCLALSYVSDKLLSADAVALGRRRNLVAGAMILSAVLLLAPFIPSLPAIMVLLTVSLTFSAAAVSWNFALANDLLRSSGDVGRTFAFLTLGGNCFGILAPIVTGYVVGNTGRFDLAFEIAGLLAVIGAVVVVVAARRPIGLPGLRNAAAPVQKMSLDVP
jgi:sugar phosphate permease